VTRRTWRPIGLVEVEGTPPQQQKRSRPLRVTRQRDLKARTAHLCPRSLNLPSEPFLGNLEPLPAEPWVAQDQGDVVVPRQDPESEGGGMHRGFDPEAAIDRVRIGEEFEVRRVE
jgi:hypothetical protein